MFVKNSHATDASAKQKFQNNCLSSEVVCGSELCRAEGQSLRSLLPCAVSAPRSTPAAWLAGLHRSASVAGRTGTDRAGTDRAGTDRAGTGRDQLWAGARSWLFRNQRQFLYQGLFLRPALMLCCRGVAGVFGRLLSPVAHPLRSGPGYRTSGILRAGLPGGFWQTAVVNRPQEQIVPVVLSQFCEQA